MVSHSGSTHSGSSRSGSDRSGDRRSGVIVPLFSCPSTRSWGIGEIPDLVSIAAWLRGAGMSVLQLLPINEMAPGQQSPYSAISAMAIDPIFIHLPDVHEFEALGGEGALPADDRAAIAAARGAATVAHASIRRVKHAALRASFERFAAQEWKCGSPRARALTAFVTEQAWWIEDYSLFRAIHAREGERPWTSWPEDLQRREPAAIDRARRDLSQEVLYFQYLQWLADSQWKAARSRLDGVAVFGNLPFMVDTDSADVWARQHQFHLDVSIGAPPDAFSADGQDWGTPLYRWDVIERERFHWLRERARRCADLFDGYRVDHLVGFYRTYGRPRDGSAAYFTPASEPEQLALGEQVLEIFREPGSEIVAEDLGTVPDFVRESLARLQVPGFKVFRWERRWHDAGQPFRPPSEYPAVSVAVSGTHDTEPMIVWWEGADADEKAKVSAALGINLADEPYDRVRDVLIEALYASASNLALLPVQDLFGWRDRINDPSVVADSNWVYRLPWPIDTLESVPEARERQQTLRRWSDAHRR
jgi:4-alpha-glucanotransferase